MYQFSLEMQADPPRVGLAYLESCTTIVPTREHADLIAAIAALMRTALASTDTLPLQLFVGAARNRSNDIDDVIGAAGHVIVDDLMRTSMPALRLEPLFVQLGAIERALSPSPAPLG